jgi:hypothetical protein
VNPQSPADSELVDDGAISLCVLVLEVLEETAALTDEHQQTPPGVVVLAVQLEMVGQAIDALREERDLHLGRPGIALVDAELLDQALLLFDGDRHGKLPPIAASRGATLHPNGFKNSCIVYRYRAYHVVFRK